MLLQRLAALPADRLAGLSQNELEKLIEEANDVFNLISHIGGEQERQSTPQAEGTVG